MWQRRCAQKDARLDAVPLSYQSAATLVAKGHCAIPWLYDRLPRNARLTACQRSRPSAAKSSPTARSSMRALCAADDTHGTTYPHACRRPPREGGAARVRRALGSVVAASMHGGQRQDARWDRWRHPRCPACQTMASTRRPDCGVQSPVSGVRGRQAHADSTCVSGRPQRLRTGRFKAVVLGLSRWCNGLSSGAMSAKYHVPSMCLAKLALHRSRRRRPAAAHTPQHARPLSVASGQHMLPSERRPREGPETLVRFDVAAVPVQYGRARRIWRRAGRAYFQHGVRGSGHFGMETASDALHLKHLPPSSSRPAFPFFMRPMIPKRFSLVKMSAAAIAPATVRGAALKRVSPGHGSDPARPSAGAVPLALPQCRRRATVTPPCHKSAPPGP